MALVLDLLERAADLISELFRPKLRDMNRLESGSCSVITNLHDDASYDAASAAAAAYDDDYHG